MKVYSNDFKCSVCGKQVYINQGEEGFYCDDHGLVPPIPQSMITLNDALAQLDELKLQVKELEQRVQVMENHECQCSKNDLAQRDC